MVLVNIHIVEPVIHVKALVDSGTSCFWKCDHDIQPLKVPT